MSEGPKVVQQKPCPMPATWQPPCEVAPVLTFTSPGSLTFPQITRLAAGERRRGLWREGVPTWAGAAGSLHSLPLRREGVGSGSLPGSSHDPAYRTDGLTAALQRSLGPTAVRSQCPGFARRPVFPRPAHPSPCSHH